MSWGDAAMLADLRLFESEKVMMDKAAVMTAIEDREVKFVVLWFTDITGIVKSVTVPAAKLEAVIDNGMHFDGSSIEGFARVAESDMVLAPDLNTFVVLPWDPPEERTARLICSVRTVDGSPFIGDPRNVLIKALKSAEEMGYSFKTGVELEFFLFQQDRSQGLMPLTTNDDASYFDISDDFSQSIRRKMILTLLAFGDSGRFGAQRDRRGAARDRLRLPSGADLCRSRADGAGRAADGRAAERAALHLHAAPVQ